MFVIFRICPHTGENLQPEGHPAKGYAHQELPTGANHHIQSNLSRTPSRTLLVVSPTRLCTIVKEVTSIELPLLAVKINENQMHGPLVDSRHHMVVGHDNRGSGTRG
eukprot:5840023-Amphidinium_carterae.1